MKEQTRTFNPDELMLPYHEWCDLIDIVGPELAAPVRDWLSKWQMFDLMNRFEEEENRGLLRLGHYQGYFSRGHDRIIVSLTTDGYLELKRNGQLDLRVTLQDLVRAGLVKPHEVSK